MNIVLDSNIIISAILKDSSTRALIINSPYKLFLPEFCFFEMKNHLPEIIKKSGIPKQNISRIIDLLLRYVRIIPMRSLVKYEKEASRIISSIDDKDKQFIAAALSLNNSAIWSNDKALKKQSKIKILSTEEIITLMEI